MMSSPSETNPEEPHPVPQLTKNEVAAHVVAHMLCGVADFNQQVTGLPIPSRPETLGRQRLRWALSAMEEEIEEFRVATLAGDVEEAADALMDLAYFALGRLTEMGVPARAVFDEVQRANLTKERGTLSKRPGSLGHDAVKPAGWQGPNHAWLLELDIDEVERIQERAARWDSLSPAFKRAHELRLTKGEDYNNVPGGRDAYFPFGHASYVHMLDTKVLRLQSLTRHMGEGRAPNFEGMGDSVVDLLNYGSYYFEALTDGRLRMDAPMAAPLSLAAPSGSDR